MNEGTQVIPYGELADKQVGAVAQIEQSRTVKEVEAQVVLAKRYPRDQDGCRLKILDSCKRDTLAKSALYSFPRGNSTVTGPSIRLAEVIAQNWHNLSYGWRELSRSQGQSEIQTYCWDLETNVFHERRFTVRHWRDTQDGGYALKEERDIYELCANMAARRLRACILEAIPGDIIEDAVTQVKDTLVGGDLDSKIKPMVKSFAEIKVTEEMLAEWLGHSIKILNKDEYINLRAIYQKIRDGQAGVDSYFGVDTPEPEKKPTVRKVASKKTASKKAGSKKDKTTAPPETTDGDKGQAEEPEKTAASEPDDGAPYTFSEIIDLIVDTEDIERLNNLKDIVRSVKSDKHRKTLEASLNNKIARLESPAGSGSDLGME